MRETPLPLQLSTDSGATWSESGDLSQAAMISKPILLGQATNFSVQLLFGTGSSPTGTFTLQVSNNRSGEIKVDAASIATSDWTDYATQAISAVGNHMFNVANAGYRWARVTYTRTSGSGTLTVNVTVKGPA